MSIIKYLLETQITLADGEVLIGAITTIDGEIYRFLSNIDGMNFYLLLKREGEVWSQFGGSAMYGEELIIALGQCIERFMEENPTHAERLNWL